MIDPNVWVSAAINPYGAPARVVEAVLSGQLSAVVSERLLGELAAVLERPKFRRWIALSDARAFVDALAEHCELHRDPRSPPRRVRDSADDYLVALAEAARATLVSGDADLLDAELSIVVIAPRALLEQLR